MELVTIVVMLALIEYFIFSLQVGMARGEFNVAAPQMTGHEVFERRHRVQMNTAEQLLIFVPAMFGFGHFVHDVGAAALGLLFIAGRALYSRSYVADPSSRTTGFMMGMVANTVLVLGTIGGAAWRL